MHTVDRVMRLKAEMLLQGTHRALSRAAPRPGTWGDAGVDLRAQLKSDKVLDVMKNPLAFLHRIPAREEKAFIHQDGRERRVSQLRHLLKEATVSAEVTILLAGILGESPVEDMLMS